MNNAMQLKAVIKNKATKTGVKANALLQNYMLERLLERISTSEYKWKFILKGGMLISAMVGLNSRTTMDMDATMKGTDLSKENLLQIFGEIIKIPLEDEINFIIKGIEEIRESDDYGGYRISLEAVCFTVVVPLKIDISTGDIITPEEIIYRFNLMFEDRHIEIPAYNLETILAEKFETTISRGILNTRARDYYDIYILMATQVDDINQKVFSEALISTAQKRGTSEKINESMSIVEEIQQDMAMQKLWEAYRKNFQYAEAIAFTDIIAAIIKLFKIHDAISPA